MRFVVKDDDDRGIGQMRKEIDFFASEQKSEMRNAKPKLRAATHSGSRTSGKLRLNEIISLAY